MARKPSKKETNGDVLDRIVEKLGGKPRKNGRFSRRNKFRAIPTWVDGRRFASKKEARRYSELKLLLEAGKISGLEMQKPFSLDVNGVHICDYRADFDYWENGQWVVNDVKGMKTREYILKRRLMLAIHNIAIKET